MKVIAIASIASFAAAFAAASWIYTADTEPEVVMVFLILARCTSSRSEEVSGPQALDLQREENGENCHGIAGPWEDLVV